MTSTLRYNGCIKSHTLSIKINYIEHIKARLTLRAPIITKTPSGACNARARTPCTSLCAQLIPAFYMHMHTLAISTRYYSFLIHAISWWWCVALQQGNVYLCYSLNSEHTPSATHTHTHSKLYKYTRIIYVEHPRPFSDSTESTDTHLWKKC